MNIFSEMNSIGRAALCLHRWGVIERDKVAGFVAEVLEMNPEMKISS
jgi:hypothetical protein